MSRKILIKLLPDHEPSSLVHRVRNCGEDLKHRLDAQGLASMSWSEIDNATDNLTVTVDSARKVARVVTLVSETLVRHFPPAFTSVSLIPRD